MQQASRAGAPNQDHVSPLDLALAFMVVAALVAIAAERLRLPYTLTLVIAGLAAGAAHLVPEIRITPEGLLILLILPLLFEGSLRMPPEDLRAYGWLIGALAVAGTLVAAAVIAGAAAAAGLPWRSALVLGAIAAAIDPVSVIALVREAGLDRRLGTILEGEAVLNDGVAIVLFAIVTGAPAGPGGPAGAFVWLLGGGAIVGVVLGAAVGRSLGRVTQPLVEALATLILAAGSFVAAERLHTSGVIAVVLAGIVFATQGLPRVTAGGRETLRTLWDVIAFLANSILFLLIGLAVPGERIVRYGGVAAAVIVAAFAARAASIYLFGALLSRPAAPVPALWRHMLVWSGLRGGVAIALTLSLPADLPAREAVSAVVFGLVVWTLLGQGLLVGPLARRLGLLGG